MVSLSHRGLCPPPSYTTPLDSTDDVFLIVEVADTTIRYDRGTKLALYARAGVPEVWIVDIDKEQVAIYRDPHIDRYRHVETRTGDAVLSPEAFPDVTTTVTELLG